MKVVYGGEETEFEELARLMEAIDVGHKSGKVKKAADQIEGIIQDLTPEEQAQLDAEIKERGGVKKAVADTRAPIHDPTTFH